ncbi:TIGR04372 family glycosyltransferase, partial [Crocosphaera watsonii]
AYYYQGNAWVAKGNYQEGINAYKQANRLGLNSQELILNWEQSAAKLAGQYIDQGNQLFSEGKLEKALIELDKAIATKPDSPWPYFYQGNIYFSLRQYQKGMASYDQALSLKANVPGLNLNYANVLLRQGKLEKSIDYFHQELRNDPNCAEAHHMLGNTLDRLNRFQEALPYWEKAIALKPGNMTIYNDIALHLMFRGERKSMIRLLEQGYEEQQKNALKGNVGQQDIRFLSSTWSSVIGHTGLLDYYIKMTQLGLNSHRHTILLARPDQIVNPCFLDYWKPYIDIVTEPESIEKLTPLSDSLQDVLAGIRFSDRRTLPYFEAWAVVQREWEKQQRSPLLRLSDSHLERGWDCLASLGVPRDAWFVCLHVREPGFHQDKKGLYKTFRNANIDTYTLAMETVRERGGYVIRLGDPSMTPLAPMSGVIDYAHSDLKSDWMDIFLCGACRFYIGTTSGLSHVPPTFGVPCAMTNWTPMGIRSPYGADLLIPKLYWLESEQRYLSLAESIDPQIGYIQYAPFLAEKRIKPVDNSPEDINALVIEMLERMEETGNYTEADHGLQREFDKISAKYTAYSSRFSRDFLKKYSDILF